MAVLIIVLVFPHLFLGTEGALGPTADAFHLEGRVGNSHPSQRFLNFLHDPVRLRERLFVYEEMCREVGKLGGDRP